MVSDIFLKYTWDIDRLGKKMAEVLNIFFPDEDIIFEKRYGLNYGGSYLQFRLRDIYIIFYQNEGEELVEELIDYRFVIIVQPCNYFDKQKILNMIDILYEKFEKYGFDVVKF